MVTETRQPPPPPSPQLPLPPASLLGGLGDLLPELLGLAAPQPQPAPEAEPQFSADSIENLISDQLLDLDPRLLAALGDPDTLLAEDVFSGQLAEEELRPQRLQPQVQKVVFLQSGDRSV